MPRTKLLFTLAGMTAIASVGFAMSSPRPTHTEFQCTNGERIEVLPTADALRVRTGAGVFNLSRTEGSDRYQGLSWSVVVGDDAFEVARTLDRKALPCTPIQQRT